MKILSLDMSTRRTGWALYENEKLVAYDLIETASSNMFERLCAMYKQIEELLRIHKVDKIICEDVPVSMHSNLQTGKDLCVLQGCILALAFRYGLEYAFLKPTVWRAEIGLNHSEYKCLSCEYTKEDISGLEFNCCPHCGNKNKKQLTKTSLNLRSDLKKRAVEMSNTTFGTNFIFLPKGSKKNGDDMAEAILIGYSYLKGCEKNGEN